MKRELSAESTWRLGWRLARYRPGWFLASLAFWTGWNVAFLPIGLLLREALDRMTGERGAGEAVWVPLAMLMGFEVLRAAIFWFAAVVWTWVFYMLVTLLRTNLLSRIVGGRRLVVLPDSPGEAVSRFRDDAEEYVNFLDLWIDVISASVFTVVALAILAFTDVLLTVTSLVPMAGALVIMRVMAPKIRANRRASRRTTSAVTGFIGETFGAVQTLKLHAAEQGVLDRFRELGEARRVAAVRDRLAVELTDSGIENLVHFGMGLILLLSASSLGRGDFTVGDFALFVFYLSWLMRLPRWLGRLQARAKQSVVSMGRLERIISPAPASELVEHVPVYVGRTDPDVPQPAKTDSDRLDRLDVRGLTYRYPDTGRGIEDVSFTLERGSFTVITGRIGSGKTTVLRSLLGLLPAERGEVLWNGRTVGDRGAFFVPPRSAYTAQVPRLFSETLRDNVLMGADVSDEQLRTAVERAVFEDDLAGLTGGFETVVGPRGVRLSGGQVQRAAAARMFVRDAELLVFDDLSSALDVDTEARLWSRVFARDGATCLVVSHRPAVLQRADQVVVLRDGRVVAAGPLGAVIDASSEMRSLWAAKG